MASYRLSARPAYPEEFPNTRRSCARKRGSAMKTFTLQASVYEDGGNRLLDQSEQRMVALVKWIIATAKIGVSSFVA